MKNQSRKLKMRLSGLKNHLIDIKILPPIVKNLTGYLSGKVT